MASTGYEELARRHLARMGDQHRLSFHPERIGRIWSRAAEIDVAAADGTTRTVLVGAPVSSST